MALADEDLKLLWPEIRARDGPLARATSGETRRRRNQRGRNFESDLALCFWQGDFGIVASGQTEGEGAPSPSTLDR